MKYQKALFLSLLVVIALLLAACSGDAGTETDGAPQPTQSGSGDSGSSGGDDNSSAPASSDALVLDPANVTSDEARTLVGYLYEGLVRMDGDNVAGALAENYTVSEDGLDYIFNLRPGIKFHDGADLNADAVIANFNRWFDPEDANRGSSEFEAWAANFGGFKGEVTEDGLAKSVYDGIEKVNDFTVLVHLNTPDPDFVKKLTDPAFSIVSPNTFERGDGGTGAYRFSALNGSAVTLEPFAGYWNPAAIPSENMEASLE